MHRRVKDRGKNEIGPTRRVRSTIYRETGAIVDGSAVGRENRSTGWSAEWSARDVPLPGLWLGGPVVVCERQPR